MKKLLIRIGLVVLAALVLLYLGRNFITRKTVELGVRKATGFPLTIGAVDFSIFGGALSITNLRLENPPEFPERQFVDLPALRVDYRTMSVLRRAPHIRELVVNVNELVLVKNAQGESNATLLQSKLGSSESTNQTRTPYRVDVLKLHIGTVTIKDYSKTTAPSVRTIRLNQDITVRDLTESTSITAVVLRQLFAPIGNVAGELVQGVSSTAQKAGKGVVDTLKKVVPPASRNP